jgi:glucose-6-phosphate isomerase
MNNPSAKFDEKKLSVVGGRYAEMSSIGSHLVDVQEKNIEKKVDVQEKTG